jgi:hypothetical protein
MYMLSSLSLRADTHSIMDVSIKLAFQEGMCTVHRSCESFFRPQYSTSYCNGFGNALPGNSSVNTVRHATLEEAVFSVYAVTSGSGG